MRPESLFQARQRTCGERSEGCRVNDGTLAILVEDDVEFRYSSLVTALGTSGDWKYASSLKGLPRVEDTSVKNR